MSSIPFAVSMMGDLRSTPMPPDGRFNVRPEPPLKRRGSFEQGRALEKLAHAIEYLSDSRMFTTGQSALRQRAEADAIQILMRASRAVFMECPEAVPLHRRVGRWLSERLVG